MYCYKCGTELKDQAVFCHNCGAKAKTVAPQLTSDDVAAPPQSLEEILHQESAGTHSKPEDEGSCAPLQLTNILDKPPYKPQSIKEKLPISQVQANKGFDFSQQNAEKKEMDSEKSQEEKLQSEISSQQTQQGSRDAKALSEMEETSETGQTGEEKTLKNTFPRDWLNKLPVIIGTVIAVIFLISISMNSGTDYKSIVAEQEIFSDMPYTCSEVFQQYVNSPKWKIRKDDNGAYVDVSGRLKGRNEKMKMTFYVNAESSDNISVSPTEISFNGKILENSATEYLYLMFVAYNAGYEDLSEVNLGIPPKGWEDLNGIQMGILVVLFFISIWLGVKIVNKAYQLCLNASGSNIMFYNRRTKLFWTFMAVMICFGIISFPFRRLFGIN